MGLVKRLTEPRSCPGRPRVLYAPAEETWLTTHQMGAVPRDAAKAGRGWAEALAGPSGTATTPSALAGVLTKVLDMLGLQPQRGQNDAIVLRYCPFTELSRESLEAICGAHSLMLKTTAEHLGTHVNLEIGPVQGRDPGSCVLRFKAAGFGFAVDPRRHVTEPVGSWGSTRLVQ